jgi:RNA polymerase sigma factor (sigma-70 family)
MPATNSEEPVTVWIRQLQGGEADAVQPIWNYFCRRLTQLARVRLPEKIRRSYDEEDVAVSAFHSLYRAVQSNRIVRIDDRDNLWRVLVLIAERKMAHRLRDEHAAKRTVKRTVTDSFFGKPEDQDRDVRPAGIDALVSREPTPEFAVEVAETCEGLMESLQDDSLREIARLRLENYTSAEIAERLHCTRRTVDRKLLEIRKRWEGS